MREKIWEVWKKQSVFLDFIIAKNRMWYANHSWKWDEESELGLTIGGGQDYGGVPGKGCKRR